jgi:hypothetical protein
MTLRTHHVVLLFLLAMVLAGNNFLTSSGPGVEEGAVPWSPDSVLRPLVEALNLRYALPTPLGIEIKSWVLGAGTAAAMVVAVAGWFVTRKPGNDLIVEREIETNGEKPAPANMSALTGAQFMFGILVLYSFISANWCFAWDLSLGGSVVLGTHLAWAFALGRGLNRAAARIGARILLVITVFTAGLAVWYFYERNPVFRAKYPIGNPLFLAAVLLPGILLGVSSLGSLLNGILRGRRNVSSWGWFAGGLIGLGLLFWALILTGGRPPADTDLGTKLKLIALAGSRASLLGLAIGLLALPFVLGGKRSRISLAAAAVLLVVGTAIFMVPRWQNLEQFGRGATVRLRLYAWSYALQMVEKRSLTGVGQGGYSLLADRADFAGRDALADPLAIPGRLAHAHNEWIETWADLGTLGLAFLAAGYLLTFAAGVSAIKRMRCAEERWALAGLLAALTALGVEEFASVGLRVPGLPAVFYAVLGLTWALSRRADDREPPVRQLPGTARQAITVGVAVLALSVAALYYRDFSGARAEYDAATALDQNRYDQALQNASFAASARLEPVRRLEARVRSAGMYARVAAAHLSRARERLARIRSGEIDPDIALPLLAEDCKLADEPLARGIELAVKLRGITPGYPDLGIIESDLYNLLSESAALKGESNPAKLDELRSLASRALMEELRRNRFSSQLVTRYLSLAAAGVPAARQIELLCGPLRGGTGASEMYALAGRLASQKTFIETLSVLLTQADRDLRSADPLKWKNPFSPEVCRLAAALEGRTGRHDSADALFAKAVQLYSQGRNAELLRLCRAQTLQDQAWSAFLGNPLSPERAIALTQQAVQAVPPIGRAQSLRQPMYSQLITLSLAASDESAARSWARQIDPHLDEQTLGLLFGDHFLAVAEILMQRQAPEAARFLDQARRLIPDAPRLLWAEANLAFRQENYAGLTDLLGRLAGMDDPRRITSFLQAALTARPDADPLREFYEQMVAERRIPPMSLTAPANRPSTTQSAPQTQPSAFDSPASPK